MKFLVALSTALIFLHTGSLRAGDNLVVHEWGTFTSLQDEGAHSIGGINTDDEPVPDFVHTIRSDLLVWPTELPNMLFGKGFPLAHPDATMRLETPVMYFYPPAGLAEPMELDVQASFRGGWLTEYYPQADVQARGLTKREETPDGVREWLGGMDENTIGSLTWRGLRVGVDAEGPRTDEHVWLAPRRVQAAFVETPEQEAERYLFYRGVGHVESMLRVSRGDDGSTLEIRPQLDTGLGFPVSLSVPSSWLAHIRSDGTSAFREVGALVANGTPDELLASVPGRFAEHEFSTHNLSLLRASMRAGLIDDGLFADEADAMLDTWEAAYFQTPGLRLFFLVPQQWTDHLLPLEFSEPVELTRVMVGRIEIVTPEQRALLAQLASSPEEAFPTKDLRELLKGLPWDLQTRLGDVADLDVRIPEGYKTYLELGRLRNALILNEARVRPTPELERFIRNYALSGYEPPEPLPAMVSPTTDIPILDEGLADTWRMQTGGGVEVANLLHGDVVFSGDHAGQFQVKRNRVDWEVSYQPSEAVDPFGYALRFALRPGDVDVDDHSAFTVSMPPAVSIDLLQHVDLSVPDWQLVDVPVVAYEPIQSVDFSGNFAGIFYLDQMRLAVADEPVRTAVNGTQSDVLPGESSLMQNYPNPFNGETVIRFALAEHAQVELVVYDLLGQTVATLVDGFQERGVYSLAWDARSADGHELASGVYLYKMQIGTRIEARKLVLLR